MTLVILGAPRTKKNHGRRIKRGRRIFHVPSQACTDWTLVAVLQLRSQWRNHGLAVARQFGLHGAPVNVRALIYRDANRGDAVGYYQAIADALEAAGVVENDRLCVSWDGSRLLVDKARPRVEITLEPSPGPDYVMQSYCAPPWATHGWGCAPDVCRAPAGVARCSP